MCNNNRHRSKGILALLLTTIAFFISGCAGIGLPVIGSSYTPSKDKTGIPDYLIVKPGEVYRGGQPTTEGFKYLKDKKEVKTIVKLNSDELEQEDQDANKFEMKLVSATIQPDGNLFRMGEIPDSNQVDIAMSAMMNKNNWPIYVHCKNGWDRTGLIIAMFRVCNDHYSKDDAYNEMIMNGFSTSHRFFLQGINDTWENFNSEEYCKKWIQKSVNE